MEEEKSVRNVDESLLEKFWYLVETSQDIRIDAAAGIINLLHSKQQLVENNGDTAACQDLQYTIKRLINGMSSSREAARHGFALALTEILKLFPAVALTEVFSLMNEHLPLSNRQEKCQMVIGQLLTYSAVIRSGRLKDDMESLPTAVLQLYLLSFGRSYIQETTYNLMLHLFTEVAEENFKEYVWPVIKKKVSCGWEACSPDTFWFLLLCLRIFPNTITGKFLMKNWGCKDLLSNDNFEHLQKIVKQSTSVHPQFSPVCSELLHNVLHRKKVKTLWNCLFDETLFESDQNEKTYLGFKVVKAALSKATNEKLVSSILSPNFSSVLTRCLLSNKHPMNSAATELASFLGNYVKENSDPQVQMLVLKAFIQPPKTVLMEQMLCKKEVIMIITNLSSEAVKLYYEVLQCLILQKSSNDEDEELLNGKRCQAFTQIGNLISHVAVLTDMEWRLQVIRFLFLHSFFEIKEAADCLDDSWIPRCGTEIYSLPLNVRQSCSHSFNRALDSLNRATGKNFSASSLLDQQLGFLKLLADYAELLLQSPDQIVPLQPLEKIQEPWNSMMHTVKKLAKQSKKDGKTAETGAFQIFFIQLGLQLFSDADYIPGIMEELRVCCKEAIKKRKDSKGDSDDPPWVQVVVDIMLSLICQESHHLRRVVNSVFSLISPFVTQEAIQQILDVIDAQKAMDGDILGEGSEDEDDVEFASGSSSEEDEEGEENQKSKKSEDVDKLKLKVRKALGAAADVSDAESEEVMTDSEMTQLDDALSLAFQSQKKVGHLQFSTEQETLMKFRIRCLDLISIYLKSKPSMSLVVQCILPILSAYQFGVHNRHQGPLSLKAKSTLQLLLKTRKFRDTNEIKHDEIRKILQCLIEKASKESNAPVGKLLNSLCLYMVVCERKLELSAQQTDKKAKEPVEPSCLEQYKSALSVFVKQINCHFTLHMFVALMSACPEVAWSFVKPLEDFAFDVNIRLFKRAQCLGLLMSSLRFSRGRKAITSKMWLDVFESVTPKAIKALIAVLSGESNIKSLYTTDLLEILTIILEFSKEKCAQPLRIENKEKLLQMLIGLNGSQRKLLTQQGKRLVNKLIKLLEGETPTMKDQPQSKRKQSEGEKNTSNESSKKSKVNKNDHESKNVESGKNGDVSSNSSSEVEDISDQ